MPGFHEMRRLLIFKMFIFEIPGENLEMFQGFILRLVRTPWKRISTKHALSNYDDHLPYGLPYLAENMNVLPRMSCLRVSVCRKSKTPCRHIENRYPFCF